MSETFVDLSYRGLALGKGVKLTQVRPTSGYLVMPTPMPVGSKIGISTNDGLQIEAVVTEIHEQVGGSEMPPGMHVQPSLDAAAASWWQSRLQPTAPAPAPEHEPATPAPVTVVSARMSGRVAVPAVVDDGRSTQVMAAIPPEPDVDTEIADVPADTNQTLPIVDDGKRTMAMDAVDLAALGLASVSQQMAAVKPEDYADTDENNGGDPGSSGPIPAAGKKKKASRKRRS